MTIRKTLFAAAASVAMAAPMALAVTTSATAAPSDHQARLQMADANGIEGSYIVYVDDVTRAGTPDIARVAQEVSSQAKTAGIEVTDVFEGLGGYAAKMTAEQVAELRKDPRVTSIVQDRIVSLDDTKTQDADAQAVGAWGIDRIDQRDLPLNNRYNAPGNQGRGVHVYIIDTGIRNHQEYSGRIGRGYDSIDNDRDPDDCQGHGSHVAGTAVGNTVGVAPKATVYGVRVLNCEGKGKSSGVIRGMDWVAKNASKPAVANMSLGGPASKGDDDAVERLHNAGITTVVAAGNSTADACKSSPARAPEAITVASSNKTDGLSWFSNFGRCVDIIAPGSDIRSASHKSSRGYVTNSGTSMASPHVAGAAALYLGENRSASPNQVARALVRNAASGKISKVQGSPNKLLNVQFLGKPGGGDGGGDGDGGGGDGGGGGDKPVPGSYTNNERNTLRNYRSVTTSVYSRTNSASKLGLDVRIEHRCANHLRLDMQAPNGRWYNLQRGQYASGSRCVTWSGTTSGEWDVNLRTNGKWSLKVTDEYGGASGTMSGWTLRFR